MTSRVRVVAGVLVGGLVAATAIAVAAGLPAGDIVVLIGITAIASAAAGLAGAMILRRFRGRPVRVQVLVVAVSALLVTVAGIVAASVAMFISTHDLVALFVVLSVSTAAAVGAAVQLGDDIGTGARQVGTLARTMVGPDDHATSLADVPDVTGPGEFAALADELATVSRRLEESRRRERALEASRRELIAWVSHDLRSPLATIRAMSEALDDGVVDDVEAVERYHRQIRADAERLTALVDDLFELSRINSGTLRLSRETAGLGDVVADALAGASAYAAVKGVTLVEHVAGLPAVEVSAKDFTRALNNLLDNAIRHTPAGGRVVVDSRADSAGAVLQVVDECGGIPEPDLARVFDIAFRGDSSRAKDDGGGGLGLAIAKGLVEAHRGSVEVANLERGCRFTIRLPSR